MIQNNVLDKTLRNEFVISVLNYFLRYNQFIMKITMLVQRNRESVRVKRANLILDDRIWVGLE